MGKIYFMSDNTAPVHSAIMQALVDGNVGHALSYGNDEDAKRCNKMFKEMCGCDVDVMYVLAWTGANVLALDSMMASHEALVCTDCCHVHTTETWAFEKILGAKIYPTPHQDGKLDLKAVAHIMEEYKDNFHHNQPAVISIAQTTEIGTVYSIEEIKVICDFAHQHQMKVHMDGARISNALAYLGCTLKEMCVDTGVDVVTFGGTKNGMMFGEANLYFDKTSYHKALCLQKQDLQVISKRRYIPLQFEAFLKDDLYLTLAAHANDLITKDLYQALKQLPEVKLSVPLQSNQAFLVLENQVVEKLSEKYAFMINHDYGDTKEVRLVTSFVSTKEEMAEFIEDLKAIYKK